MPVPSPSQAHHTDLCLFGLQLLAVPRGRLQPLQIALQLLDFTGLTRSEKWPAKGLQWTDPLAHKPHTETCRSLRTPDDSLPHAHHEFLWPLQKPKQRKVPFEEGEEGNPRPPRYTTAVGAAPPPSLGTKQQSLVLHYTSRQCTIARSVPGRVAPEHVLEERREGVWTPKYVDQKYSPNQYFRL